MLTENQKEFVEWMQENAPNTYGLAVLEATDATQLNGLNADQQSTQSKGWFENFTDSIKKIAPALMQFKTQKKIMRTQLRRAERGLPPLDTSALAPTLRIQPELPPEVYRDIKKYVLPAAVGIGAILFGLMLSRKK